MLTRIITIPSRVQGALGKFASALGPLVLLAAYAATLRGWLPAASAQEVASERLVEALARISVAEAGWDPATGDAAAISHLLVRRADRLGRTPLAMARAYSSSHFDRARTDERRWIVGLTLAGTRPAGWPERLPWHVYRSRWLDVVEHVRAVLRGEVPDPCGGEADHWGAPYGLDLERALRAGWRRLDCGPTRNAYWRVPGVRGAM